ncbi:bifunctional phosphoribosylaminoimidazolecarboxamide formyltransferase/IMP cyclohydrolase [Candidatus Termititenax aidoneus]|uniref:Bifunctional purine biosynthesis protein PurH n=1 Tax=Termititenax aidoneus TaxID=2218524 RepID=A0A388TEC8_TERA1|nr:bifunctional phosphoribosylaminoimidazolecarboxamide formyltransferase/IMP cyclohydrolase [Candidatus Termititenax aidoneus]
MRALVSVSDKTGVVEFCQGLAELGCEIISTGGTAKVLKENGVKTLDISEVTGFPEMLDGRVKTLHPKIHGGLLALRDNPEHAAVCRKHDITFIDIVAVNLYPFEQTVAKPDTALAEAIENIDIGGPSMLRSAAKNYRAVTVLTDPKDYAPVLAELRKNKTVPLEVKEYLAVKVFERTAAYDKAISDYLNKALLHKTPTITQTLRYGENPHQNAVYIGKPYTQLHGKELSFNNIIDIDAAQNIVADFDEPAVAIVKHTNPCGAAIGATPEEAYDKALACDPVSAYGGIVGVNRPVSAELAERVAKLFVEVVVAPDFTPDALAKLREKKNIRLIKTDLTYNGPDVKRTNNGYLVQDRDRMLTAEKDLRLQTKKSPQDLRNLLFAWKICRHVKSNAIVLARDGATIGVGAGQMSRIDALDCAVKKAREHNAEKLPGCLLASDAYFPFRDVVDSAAKIGVREIIQPGGSVRDAESIAACDEHGLAMVFTGRRHFKH